MLHRWAIAIVVVTAACKAHQPGDAGPGPDDGGDAGPIGDAAISDAGPIGDAGGGGACERGFAAQQWLPAGHQPNAIVSADLDGDRRPDLIVANTDASISVMINRGGGRFRPTVSYPTDPSNPAFGLAVGDLDRDGVPDVVVASGVVSVFLGNGDGTLQPRRNVTDISATTRLALADLDGDGVLDLVTNDGRARLGHGDGTFAAPVALEIGGTQVVLADVNRDGHIDVLIPNFNQVGVQLGRGDGTFGPAATYETVNAAFALAVGDLDGDGTLDLVVASTFDEENNASWLFGNGDGTFQAHLDFHADRGQVAVALADVDGDHKLDMVFATDFGPGSVQVQGTRGFSRVAVGSFPSDMVLVDLDGDGDLDIATANNEGENASVALNRGDGTFASDTPLTAPVASALVDLDGDGVLDAIGASDASVVVQRGRGDGTFAPATSYPTASHVFALTTADVDRDGKLDVVALSDLAGPQALSVLRGQGDGTLAPAVGQPSDGGARTLAAVDLDGDGKPDLVEAYDRGAGAIRVLLGAGDGTFRFSADYLPPQDQQFSALPTFAIADFNADGVADVAVLDLGGGPVRVLIGNGDGTFHRGADAPIAGTMWIGAADVNADHRADVVVVGTDASQKLFVAALLGAGDGTFSVGPVGQAGFLGLLAAELADATGDGVVDLVVSDPFAQVVRIVPGDGSGGFGVPVEYHALGGAVFVADVTGDAKADMLLSGGSELIADCVPAPGPPAEPPSDAGVPDAPPVDAPPDAPAPPSDPAALCAETGFPVLARPPTGRDPRAVVVADVDGDHRADLIVANHGDATVSVLRGRGNGAFLPRVDVPVAAGSVSAAVTDLDRDGVPDLVAATGSISVARGHGDGTFAAATELPTGGAARWIAAGDIDGDGVPDLVASDTAAQQLRVLRGHGDGTFEPPTSYPTGAAPGLPVLADVNRDGVLDVVLAADNTFDLTRVAPNDAVSVWLGVRGGPLGPRVDLATGGSTSGVAVADLDRDGALDLVVANAFDHVDVLLGNGDGTFRAPTVYGLASQPETITAADVDGDGALDVVIGNRLSGLHVVLRGNGDGTLRRDAQTGGIAGDSPAQVLADVSGDGKLDLIAPFAATNDVSVVLGRGDGTFADQPALRMPGAWFYADLDHDGKLDAVSPDGRTDFGVQLGNGDGTFQRFIRWNTGQTPVAGAAADINHDGNMDVLTFNRNDDTRDVTISSVFGHGDGTFDLNIDVFVLEFTTITSIVAADVNADGNADVALVTPFGLELLLGDGHGGFSDAPGALRTRGPAVSSSPPSGGVTFIDVSGDGKLDLLTLFGANLVVQLGHGDGSFGAPVSYGANCVAYAVADVTGDGVLDLVVGDADGGVTIQRGAGDGSFAAQPTIATGSPLQQTLAVGDVTGDGVPDIVVDGPGVLRGHGDGTFEPRVNFSIAIGGFDLLDLRGDRTQELVGGALLSLKCPP